MLSLGLDGLLARTELIDAADAALDLQYYIFHGDESGDVIVKALLRAADRGVRVRLFVDDGETVRGDEKIWRWPRIPTSRFAYSIPSGIEDTTGSSADLDFLIEKRRLDYRMHNKLLVADNAVALIGGRNIGDQYFQIDPQSQFGDDDVVAVGPIVAQLSGVFDEYLEQPPRDARSGGRARHASAALCGLPP